MKNIVFFLMTFILLSACKKDKSPTDDDNPVTVFRFTDTIIVDGLERTFIVNLPPNYNNAADFSLVIAMHGGGGSGRQFDSTSRLSTKANAENFIIVFPDGNKGAGPLGIRTWNAGGCCGAAVTNNVNDVKFIRNLIDELVANYKINPKKVYATGHSNGGMLSYRLACEAADKIAAIAPNGCSMSLLSPCNASRPVPVLHMHSVLDTQVPYMGGVGTGISNTYFPPLDSVLNVWSNRNGCNNSPQIVVNNSQYKLTRWNSCSNNGSIQYYLTQDGGHGWPGGLPGGPNSDVPSVVIDANNLLWNFFQQHQLP